jgi:3-oxoacid CoA-transferase
MKSLFARGTSLIWRSSIAHRNSSTKVYPSALEALDELQDGMTVLFGGFGVCGVPENLIDAVLKKGTKQITAVGNDCCS